MHAAILLAQAPKGTPVTRQTIADYHDIPESYLAKHLKVLVSHGIFSAVSGPNGGYQLARPASQITGLDIFEAVEGRTPAFQCTEIRQQGKGAALPSECRKTCTVNALMQAGERAWRQRLMQTTIADLVESIPASAQARNRETLTRTGSRST
jgi:Rrf2 family protein